MFGSLGFLQHVEAAHQTHRQPQAGLFVVARTKNVDQVESIKQQTRDPAQVSPESPSQTQQRTRELQGGPENQHMNTQDEPTIVTPHVPVHILPQPLVEPGPHTPVAQTVEEAQPELMIQPESVSKSHAQASSPSQNDKLGPALTEAPVGPKRPQSPVLFKHITSPVSEGKGSSSPSQSQTSRIRGQPKSLQSNKTCPQPPVMVRSEVHSKAQSMARSRLEKARFRLQGRIQQAIKLFGGRDISESQAKRKQVQF